MPFRKEIRRTGGSPSKEKTKSIRCGLFGKCCIVLVILFVLSLIPVFSVGVYDRVYSDDYDYSQFTQNVRAAGGSIAETLSAAADAAAYTYETWQGTYSAAFLFALQPAIWGQKWYAVTPIILIGTLVCGLGWFLHSFCLYVLRSDRRTWLFTWMTASILCIQFPRDASEGFYWYNGGMFYTFFFGLFFIWMGLAVGTMFKPAIRRANTLLRTVLMVLLGGIIAGGNYPTALLFGIVLLCFLGWSILKNRRMVLPFLLTLAIFACGFTVSALAPGNAVRQALLQKLGPVSAIASAIAGTPKRMAGQLLRHPGAAALLLLVWAPFSVVALRSSQRRFRFPWLLPILSWLILAALFTPSFYAMSSAGPYRLWNIVIFMFYLLCMANICCVIGWIKSRFPTGYAKLQGFLVKRKKWAPLYLLCIVCAAILLSGVGPSIVIERESGTSVRAAEAILDGSAQEYANAFDREVESIERSTDETVSVSPIPQPDSILPDGDITRYLKISNEPALWFDKTLIAEE